MWPGTWPSRILAAIWASPILLVGIVGALLFRIVQPASRLRMRGGAIEVLAAGPFARWMWRNDWGAFTLGCSIWLWSKDDAESERLFYHERRHLTHYLALGIFIVPVFLLCLIWLGYEDGILEVDARAHEPPS